MYRTVQRPSHLAHGCMHSIRLECRPTLYNVHVRECLFSLSIWQHRRDKIPKVNKIKRTQNKQVSYPLISEFKLTKFRKMQVNLLWKTDMAWANQYWLPSIRSGANRFADSRRICAPEDMGHTSLTFWKELPRLEQVPSRYFGLNHEKTTQITECRPYPPAKHATQGWR